MKRFVIGGAKPLGEREELLQLQKHYGPIDRDLAKLYKELANELLRLIRAYTFHLPWLGVPDSNQEPVRPVLWPTTLAPELDRVSHRIVLKFG